MHHNLYLIFFLFFGSMKLKVLVTQSCATLCDPMKGSLPGSSVHGILQVRILEWVAISLSRRSSQPRDWTRVSCITDRFFFIWATRKPIFWSIVDLKCYLFQVYDIVIQYVYRLCSIWSHYKILTLLPVSYIPSL